MRPQSVDWGLSRFQRDPVWLYWPLRGGFVHPVRWGACVMRRRSFVAQQLVTKRFCTESGGSRCNAEEFASTHVDAVVGSRQRMCSRAAEKADRRRGEGRALEQRRYRRTALGDTAAGRTLCQRSSPRNVGAYAPGLSLLGRTGSRVGGLTSRVDTLTSDGLWVAPGASAGRTMSESSPLKPYTSCPRGRLAYPPRRGTCDSSH